MTRLLRRSLKISFLGLFLSGAHAASIIGPVELARWDADFNTFASSTIDYPNATVGDVVLFDGQPLGGEPGFLSPVAFSTLTPPPTFRGSLAEFSITNDHPTEPMEIWSVEFMLRREAADGLILGLSYAFGDGFFEEINDAIFVGSSWGQHTSGPPFSPTLFVIPPEETATILIQHVQSNGPGRLILDNIVVQGFTVIPEPSSAILGFAGAVALAFRRRRR